MPNYSILFHAFIARIKKLYRGLASGGNVLLGENNLGSAGFGVCVVLVGGGNLTARFDLLQSKHRTSPSDPDFLH